MDTSQAAPDTLFADPDAYQPAATRDGLEIQLLYYGCRLEEILPAYDDLLAPTVGPISATQVAFNRHMARKFYDEIMALRPVVADIRVRLGKGADLPKSYDRSPPPVAPSQESGISVDDRDVGARLAGMHGSWHCPACGFSGYGACQCGNLPTPQLRPTPLMAAARVLREAEDKLAAFEHLTQHTLAEICAEQMNDHGVSDMTVATLEKTKLALNRERLGYEHAVAQARQHVRQLINAKPSPEPVNEPSPPTNKRRRMKM